MWYVTFLCKGIKQTIRIWPKVIPPSKEEIESVITSRYNVPVNKIEIIKKRDIPGTQFISQG